MMQAFVHELSDNDPLRSFAPLRHLPYSILFDSADPHHPNSQYSFIACVPFETIEAKNGITTVTSLGQQTRHDGDPFALVAERIKSWNAATKAIEGLPPFQGGAAGFFGYDLARGIENLPDIASDDPDMPDMAIGLYDQVLAYDHAQGRAWIITHAANEDEARIKQKHLLRLIARETTVSMHTPDDLPWEANFDAHDYKIQVRKVLDYIKAGDIFQANLSQRFDAELPRDFDSYAHYLRMRDINPAPYASYFNVGGRIVISSSSPEKFLSVKNGQVKTSPIKGTRPHVEDPVMDKVYRKELENSDKERAENTMIVDLLRNDLSKVCTAESVKVTSLCGLETFASVHHLVSTIEGKLEDGKGPLDALRACFPGGSITGAPKIRAMEIIEELEPTRRGPYCGALGYIGFDGSMDTSILIRTLVYKGNSVSLQAGGGITADSKPDEEYQETFYKAEAIFRSFEEHYGIHVEDLADIA